MKGLVFLAFAIALAVVYVVVPFVLLSGIARFAACFLLWTTVTLAAVVGAALYTRRWRDA